MKLIVGLGNPEPRYDLTYHNIGFAVLDALADGLDAPFLKKECKALTAHTYITEEPLILAKPQTYMNLSGEAVSELAARYKLDVSRDVLVVVDDIDLDVGVLRLRTKGSPGTHNGLRNIAALVGPEFMRLRIGIGRPQNAFMDLAAYVLSKIAEPNKTILLQSVGRAVNALKEWAGGADADTVGLHFNGAANL